MENNELRKVCIQNRTYYYFGDIIKLEDFDIYNILIDESHKNMLIYSISYKTLIDPKPLCIRFDKIDGINRIFDGTRYLVLFGPEKCDAIYNRIRYLISLKSSIAYAFSYYYSKIKVDSYDFLPIEKTFTLHNVIILIKSVLNKDQNYYYYNKDQNYYYYTIFIRKSQFLIKIDISKGIDPTKSNRSKECMIYRYWFCNRRFKVQD